MTDLFEKLKEVFDFRWWSDSLKYLVLTDSDENKLAFTEHFKGGLQKTIILSLLVVACNITFRSVGKAENVTGMILPIAVAGFSLYLVTFHSMNIFIRKNERTRYYSNLLILHLVLTLSIVLLANVTRVSNNFYESQLMGRESPKPYEIKVLTVFVIATGASFVVSISTLINTQRKLFRDQGVLFEWKIVAKLCLLTAYSAIATFGFLMAKIPSAN
jgi:hypothetical protein